MHSVIERFILIDRDEGRRDFTDIKNLNYKQIDLRKYFIEQAETSDLHKAIIYANTSATPLQFLNHTYNSTDNITTADTKKKNWKQKMLYGKHPHHLTQPHVKRHSTHG